MTELEEQVIIGDAASASTHVKKLNRLELNLCALRKLQLETEGIQGEFFKDIYELEMEYHKKHEQVYKKRCDIINGIYVPTEAQDIVPESAVDGITEKLTNVSVDCESEGGTTSASGVPKFWLSVLSSTLFHIHPFDRPILEHLTDVRSRNKPFSDFGFILEFEFSPNEYFENSTLTKEYFYTCSLNNAKIHEGPQIYKSAGCDIKWKEGKALSKHSFFKFFDSNITNQSEETLTNDYDMTNDFEMGYFIKERIIPRAVLYYKEYNASYAYPKVFSSSSSGSVISEENKVIASTSSSIGNENPVEKED